MKRTIAHALTVFAFLAAAGSSSLAQDYQCRDSAGCIAYKSKNGLLTATSFRKGDLIATQDGWTIDPENGWKKIKSARPMRLR